MNNLENVLFDFTGMNIDANTLFNFFRQTNPEKTKQPIESLHKANNLQIFVEEGYRLKCLARGQTGIEERFLIRIGFETMKALRDMPPMNTPSILKTVSQAIVVDLQGIKVCLNPFNGLLGEAIESDVVLFNSQAQDLIDPSDEACSWEKMYGGISFIPEIDQHKIALATLPAGNDFYIYSVSLSLFC